MTNLTSKEIFSGIHEYQAIYSVENETTEYLTIILDRPRTATLGYRIAMKEIRKRSNSASKWEPISFDTESDLCIALENEFIKKTGYYANTIPAIPNKSAAKEVLSNLIDNAREFYNKHINGIPLNRLSTEQRNEWEELCSSIMTAVNITEKHNGLTTLLGNYIFYYCQKKITKEQFLHFATVTPNNFTWYQQFAYLTGDKFHKRLSYEVSRIAGCLVNRHKYHNPESGFTEWKFDAPLYALEAEKYQASLW